MSLLFSLVPSGKNKHSRSIGSCNTDRSSYDAGGSTLLLGTSAIGIGVVAERVAAIRSTWVRARWNKARGAVSPSITRTKSNVDGRVDLLGQVGDQRVGIRVHGRIGKSYIHLQGLNEAAWIRNDSQGCEVTKR